MKRDSAIPLILLAVMSAVSCIKEDRSDCPCRLVLDFRDVDTSIVRAADIRLTSEEGFGFNDVVASSGFEGYMITVPRTTLQVCAWAGAGDCLNEDMSVSIPLGQECPRLFLHVSSADADCELLEEKVMLRKNHCVLTVMVEKGGTYPFDLTVKGRVDGYGPDFNPRTGDFSCRAVPDTSGICTVVLPRQLDSSLILEIDDGTETLKTFAIGESIVAGGYDWNAEDLDDVTIEVDYSLTDIFLDIVDWDKESVYDVVI